MNSISKNVGKKFEDCIVNSLPDYILKKRLNDGASSWAGGTNTRFTANNECDFILFDSCNRILFCLELKSTSSSITYWRSDFEIKGKKNSFQIKKNQILGLDKFNSYDYVVCGFLFNFRHKENHTFFVDIQNFLNYTENLDKKSINYDDVLKMQPIKIDNKLLKTNYRYDMDKFFIENFKELKEI